MIESDIGDNAQVGRDDIGTVETSAQTYLDHGYIYFLRGKIEKGHLHSQLEE